MQKHELHCQKKEGVSFIGNSIRFRLLYDERLIIERDRKVSDTDLAIMAKHKVSMKPYKPPKKAVPKKPEPMKPEPKKPEPKKKKAKR